MFFRVDRGIPTQLACCRLNRRPRAGKAQPELAVVPKGSGNRQRLAAPFVESANGLGRIALENQRRFGHRFGQHLERDFGDDAERAETASDEARHVVAGDVFHDLAAEIEQLAGPIDQFHTEHEVAHRTGLLPARAGEAGSDTAADRRRTEMRRLEGQHLAFFGQRGLDLGERRSTFGRDVKLGRLVGDDAPMGRDVEHLTGQHATVEILAAGAADA